MTASDPLNNKSILLIITGSVAAYKCADLVRRLRERGATVRCVMTGAAQKFITPLLMASLSQQEVYTDLWSLKDETEMGHIRLSREADVVLVAPASANTLAKLAHGTCDDLASTVLMATDKPVMVAPAMNPMMWENLATQHNIALLRLRGIEVLAPAAGIMACGESGKGRMIEVPDILDRLAAHFSHARALEGFRAVVTAGPTYEAIDPVRFIGNFSSGKQGYAIAYALASAGAEVTLVSGPSYEDTPPGVTTIRVTSADEMLKAVMQTMPADIAVCVAAVADWKPAKPAKDKIKKGKGAPEVSLVENVDILKTISNAGKKRPKLVIGFAAETADLKAHAEKKLASKNCDWILANDVGPGTGVFGGDFNTVNLVQRTPKKTRITPWPKMTKDDVAAKLVEEIISALKT